MRSEKVLKIVLIVVETLWVMLLACACVAFVQVITAHAEAPKIIMNGEYVVQVDAIDIDEAPPINNVSNALDVLDDALDANGRKLEYLGEFVCTTYCPCRKCNGHWGAIDGYGNPLVLGTVAVDPSVVKLQTHLIIDGYDIEFVARDTGSGVNGKHVDIFMPVSHSEALRMDQGNKRKVWKVE